MLLEFGKRQMQSYCLSTFLKCPVSSLSESQAPWIPRVGTAGRPSLPQLHPTAHLLLPQVYSQAWHFLVLLLISHKPAHKNVIRTLSRSPLQRVSDSGQWPVVSSLQEGTPLSPHRAPVKTREATFSQGSQGMKCRPFLPPGSGYGMAAGDNIPGRPGDVLTGHAAWSDSWPEFGLAESQ